MSFSDDYDILQDFLTEVGEILELLSEQLVELEQRPDDTDLLNAIFRGFHTVKGGAGFLQLDAMVECCHVTENLFDVLRNHKRKVTPSLMDVVLLSLDTINVQFDQVSNRIDPDPADPDLITALTKLVNGEDLIAEPNSATKNIDNNEKENGDKDNRAEKEDPLTNKENKNKPVTDSEFEELLDAIDNNTETNGNSSTNSSTTVSASVPDNDTSNDEITEDEFEALLDQLHGKKNKIQGSVTQSASTIIAQEATGQKASESSGKSEEPSAQPHVKSSDEINEGEFEDLLDQLHGKGHAPGSPTNKKITSSLSEEKNTASKSVLPSEASSGSTQPSDKNGGSSTIKTSPLDKQSPSSPKAPANVATVETTVRVDTQRLDDIMNMVGELVLVRNRLVRLGTESDDEELSKAVSNLDVVTADLQSSVMKTRMQPIKKVFGRFPRVVRDLARSMKKEISLELKGEETDLDKNLVEALADPLVHLVRNAVDHGIEKPNVREAAGKSRVGKVVLSAEQEGDHILLSITDDGAGMDPDSLREKAVEKGLYDEDGASRLTDTEAFELIFAPGFSTKTEISDVSGRGVGMDVVKTKITQLNGTIEITSVLGEGSRLNIKVPLTLAIMPTLMIMLEHQTFALPLVSVNEIFHMDLKESNVVDGQECVSIRNKAIPIFHLKKWLVNQYTDQPPAEFAHVVIVTVGNQRVGFVVDQLVGQEEVVIKPLGKMLQGTPGMAGATITGDGTIALILDVPSMLKRYAH
ncbi:MAG: chemotaxis protein CheA [Cellvibrionaceae bacterium]